MTNNYDLKAMRIELIKIVTKSLDKKSKFYKEDYETIVRGVNKKTRKELIESLERQNAIAQTTQAEINKHFQFD
jgi:hypothetical protein